MKIADLERYLALAKIHGCTDITFWDDGKTFDINQTNTTYPLDDIGSHVSSHFPNVYSVVIDRTDRDDDHASGYSDVYNHLEESDYVDGELKFDILLHIIRNPFGWSEDEVRVARLAAADRLEKIEFLLR